MDFSVRKFVEKDIPFLWEMLYQAIYTPEGQQSPTRDILKDPKIEKYLKDWGRTHDHALIASNLQGNPIGAIWIRRLDRDHAGYGFVDELTPELGMAILAEYRGHGVGRQLMSSMFELARSQGYSALSLSVDPRNTIAKRLYEKNRFELVYKDKNGFYIMKKAL